MKINSLAFNHDAFTQGLSVYCVGGAVRDTLLQQTVDDKDWVIVGATPEQMVARGFIPVGGHFPVFLHPHSKEEYALARTERKSGKGYQGFTFYTGINVTLEEDLKRRDFTVNAMACDSRGTLYDPYGGMADLHAKTFRHVSSSFVEDPLRMLRVARLLSRFSDFSVDSATVSLCRDMVDNNEVDALVPERIWKEISRALCASMPSRCFDFLASIGALPRIVPNFVWSKALAHNLNTVAQQGASLSQCYAVLSMGSSRTEQLAVTLRVAREQKEYGHYFAYVRQSLLSLGDLPHSLPLPIDIAEKILQLIESVDGFRKPERLLGLIEVALWLEENPYSAKEINISNKIGEMGISQHIGTFQHNIVSGTAINIQTALAQWQTIVEKLYQIQAGVIASRYKGDIARIKLELRKARLEILSMSC